jgi:pyruvate formate lyase activating enzyme
MITDHSEKETKGYIFDIQGLSVHDGPGCRTLIFLSGCSLNCFWCSNPEGISKKPLPLHFNSKCISCFDCIKECRKNAITNDENGYIINREICYDCKEQKCVSACYTDALKLSGYEITVSKLIKIIQRDRQFWGSGGGMTLTGGEPLLQIDFAREILKHCHESYIHTAVETCGNIPKKNFDEVMPYLDWIFFDLKHMNSKTHLKGTKSGNKAILENAKYVAGGFEGRLIFRLPLIPMFNDSIENIHAVISFIKDTGRNEINVLPLHHLGREKYPIINRTYSGLDHPVPTKSELNKIKKIFTDENIKCYIGSETPF